MINTGRRPYSCVDWGFLEDNFTIDFTPLAYCRQITQSYNQKVTVPSVRKTWRLPFD